MPAGTVVLTGTGIIVPQEAALAPGDVVTIRVPEIGELVNTARDGLAMADRERLARHRRRV